MNAVGRWARLGRWPSRWREVARWLHGLAAALAAVDTAVARRRQFRANQSLAMWDALRDPGALPPGNTEAQPDQSTMLSPCLPGRSA